MSEVKNKEKPKIAALKVSRISGLNSLVCFDWDEELIKHYNINQGAEPVFLYDLFRAIQDFGIIALHMNKDDYYSGQVCYGKVLERKIIQIGDYQKDIIQEMNLNEFMRVTKEFFFLDNGDAEVIIFKLIDNKVTLEGYALDGSLITK